MAWLGILLALVTSVSWGVGNVLTQRLGKLVGPPRATFWGMATGALLATPCALMLDARTAPIDRATIVWALVAGAAGVIGYIGLFFAFANEGLTIAVPIASSWPLVASMLSIAFFGEVVRGRNVLGGAIVIAGVVLVTSSPSRAAKMTNASRGALLAATAAAVGFGVMVPAMARIAPATGAFGATVCVYVIGVVLARGVGLAAGISMAAPPRTAWKLVLATGTAETLGFVAIALARSYAPMTVVGPVASVSSPMTVLFAWLVLGERPGPRALAGAALVAGGVTLLAA